MLEAFSVRVSSVLPLPTAVDSVVALATRGAPVHDEATTTARGSEATEMKPPPLSTVAMFDRVATTGGLVVANNAARELSTAR